MSDPPDDARNDPNKIWGDILRSAGQLAPPAAGEPTYKVIGTSAFATRYGSPDRQATGHWCSRCKGIWFGYLLEVACPACGNRHG